MSQLACDRPGIRSRTRHFGSASQIGCTDFTAASRQIVSELVGSASGQNQKSSRAEPHKLCAGIKHLPAR